MQCVEKAELCLRVTVYLNSFLSWKFFVTCSFQSEPFFFICVHLPMFVVTDFSLFGL